MNTDNEKQITAEEEAVQAETAPAEEAKPKKESKKDKKNAEIEKLALQLAELDDKYKRVLAEYDNYRKRTAKERESVFGDGKASAVSAFLPLIDNLERGASQENADEGVKMMLKQAVDILDKMHIKPVGAKGESFDPNFHNAVLHVDDETLGENEIAEVLMCGYKMDERLLRPAVVKVAN
ncbi:MAG: nucleotide exchange factor GrpE [Clostridia bacterium]|nr:nucleotide exchange factor GrpE [Clostridia bacterium]MBR5902860.1 nucleotide exchange factor GrpE [Clostridia bacterium]